MGGTNEKEIKEIMYMMTHDYYKEELSNVPKIDESQLPKVIVEQFKDVDIIKNQITQAKNRAEEAKKKSEELQKVGRFGGGKKAAIEDLQESAKMFAMAQEQTVLAQGLFFEYQEKLSKATKWLFELGVNNAANTETIIRQLEIYMEGGSADELDELKQTEINAVINRLLQQESMQKKQEKMWEQIDSMDLELAEQHEINKHQAKEIKHNREKNDEQDKLISAQAQKDEEHDRLLAESKKKDKEQDKELKLRAQKDEEHDRLLTESKKKDEEQDKELKLQAQKDEEHDRLLAESKKKDKEQDKELKLQAQKDEEHDRLLTESKKKDEEQDKELKLRAQKDEEHDRLLAESKKKDEEQDKELKLQAQKDEEHDRLLTELKRKDEEQDKELVRQAKNDERHDLLLKKQDEINDFVFKDIERLSEELSSLLNSVNEMDSQKTSKSMNIVSLLIALAALGISIAQFFM